MSKLITAIERIQRARMQIQKARDLPRPVNSSFPDFSYVATVKDMLRQVRDLIKFIPMSPSATPEMKAEVSAIFKEIEQAEIDLLH